MIRATQIWWSAALGLGPGPASWIEAVLPVTLAALMIGIPGPQIRGFGEKRLIYRLLHQILKLILHSSPSVLDSAPVLGSASVPGSPA